jgi:hypothetical protein
VPALHIRSQELGDSEPRAIVLDVQTRPLWLQVERNLNGLRLSMLGGIVQALLEDAIDSRSNLI